MISSIPLFEIISAVVPDQKIFFLKAWPVAGDAANDSNDIKTLLVNDVSTLFINGTPTV